MAMKVGEDIDAWCTKCRTDTLHVVVALKPGTSEPKRCECKECHGQHNYHAPKIAAPKQAPVVPTVHNRTAAARAPAKPAAPKAAKPQKPIKPPPGPVLTGPREWVRRMDDLAIRNIAVKPYSMRETFVPGEPVSHPKFGKGVVLEILEANKCAILFEEGRKVLAMGGAPAA